MLKFLCVFKDIYRLYSINRPAKMFPIAGDFYLCELTNVCIYVSPICAPLFPC